jgi:hypothetical protein
MKLKYKLRSLWEEIKLRFRVLTAALGSLWAGEVTPVGRLYVTKVDSLGNREPLGLVSTKVVTTAGVNYLVDSLQGLQPSDVFRFHGTGTGTTAEAIGQTALVTEVASRATGSQTEGASTNIYRTVGTVSYGATFAITEHGIFSASTAGTLLDRSLFAAINVISGDSIEFTYELTVPSGS